MSWINNESIIGYFGSLEDNLYDHDHYDDSRFLTIAKKIQGNINTTIDCTFFPKQIHTANIVVIENNTDLKKPLHLFIEKADAVITKEKNIAIGVVTADCLPIFLYDPVHRGIGVIHAGWRGLAANIITKTIIKMHDQFQTNPTNLIAYLGPSADVCCYEVQTDLLAHFSDAIFDKKIAEKHGGKYFFNPKNSAILELLENNVFEKNIDVTHHICTICNETFCSVRRQKENAGRQPSIVLLRD